MPVMRCHPSWLSRSAPRSDPVRPLTRAPSRAQAGSRRPERQSRQRRFHKVPQHPMHATAQRAKLSAKSPTAARSASTMVNFGRDICSDLQAEETREWLVTKGIGGFASGTVAGTTHPPLSLCTRRCSLRCPTANNLGCSESLAHQKHPFRVQTDSPWEGSVLERRPFILEHFG